LRIRFIRIAGLTIGGIVIAGVALLHTPPVKRYALAQLQRALQAQGISLQAAGLNFNLLTLQGTLHGVVVTPEPSLPPLARIDSVSLKLSLADLLRGKFVISNATVQHPEVWLVINAAGLDNLPKSKGESSTGEPFEYLAESLIASNGSLHIDDQRANYQIVLPQWDVRVAGNRITDRHRIQLDTKLPGKLIVAGKYYPIEFVGTVLDAGRKDLRFEEITLRAPGAKVAGSIALLDYNQLGLKGKINVDVEPAKYFPDLSGQVRAALTIAGNMKEPVISAQVQTNQAGYGNYRNVNLSGDFGYDTAGKALTAKGLNFSAPFGSFSGDGRVSVVATDNSEFKGTVRDLSLGHFVPGLASSASGTLNAQWKGIDVARARGSADLRLTASRQPAKGTYPIAGNFRVQTAGGNTTINIANAALSGIQAAGTVSINARDQLSGNLTLQSANIAAQPYAELPVSCPATASLTLSGTTRKPAAAFTVNAPSLTAKDITGIALTASGNANADRLDLTQSTINWGGQSLVASGSIGLKGTAAPLSIQTQITNANIAELLTVLGRAEIPVTGTANLTANISGTTDRPEGTASIDVTNVEAYGEKLGHLTATARFDKTTATIPDLVLEKSPSEKLQGQGTYDFPSERFTASIQSNTLRLTRGSVAIDAQGSGTVQQPVVTANLKGELNDLGPLTVKADLNGTSLNLTADAPKQNVKANASGTTVAPYPFTLKLDAQNTDLASLPAAIPKNLEGKVTATINATGEAANWEKAAVDVEAQQLALVLDGHPIRTEGPLSATLREGALDLKPVKLIGPGTELTAAGQVPGLLQLNGTVNLAAAQKAFLPDQTATGELTLSGEVRSTLQNGRYTLDPQLNLQLANGTYANPSINPVTAANMQARLADGTLQINSLQAAWSGAAITGKGELPLGLLATQTPFDFPRKSGPANAELSVKGLNFAQFKDVPETIGGQASFTAKLESARPDLEALTGEVRFDELRVQADRLTLSQETPSTLRINSGTVSVEQFQFTGPSSKLTLAGTAQLTGAQALNLRLDSNIDLAVLSAFTRSVRAQGPTVASVNIGGTVKTPDMTGFLEVTGADASIASPRVQAENVSIRVDLAKNRVTLSRLSGGLNGGTLEGSGGFNIRGGAIESPDLRVASTGVFLDFPAKLKTMSNAAISLRSTGNRYVLGGTINIVDGSFTEPVNLDQGVLNALNSSYVPETREERVPFLEKLDLNIAVKTENPIVVDNNLAKAEIDLDARLTGNYYRPGLLGRATLEEGGTVYLNERNYLIDRGVLTFTDENKIDPSFDILAKAQASGYDITLAVQGGGRDRETTLTSDPPLPEPDIASVLLTGRTMEELSGNEGDVAKEQILSYLTGRVGGTLGRGIEQATGISQFRIEPNLIANESDPSARLTIGQNFTRQLSLIYSMNLTDSNDQLIVGQYDISKRFRTRTIKQTDNTYRFDFSRKQEFGGTAPPPASTAERERKKVGGVQFSGQRLFTDEQLAKWLAARQGKTYDFFKVRRGIEKISGKHAGEGYLEARVRLARTNRENLVDLDVSVESGPKVDFVYEGYHPPRGVEKKIREQWHNGVFDIQRADDAKTILLEELAEDGFLAVKIDFRIDTSTPGRKRVIFDIQPGDKYEAPKIAFAGAKGIDESELRQLLRERKLTLSAVTNPTAAIEPITYFYRDRGFLDTKVAKPEIILNAAARTAMIVYPVDEGPLYSVASVKFAGNTVFESAELRPSVTIETGAAYSPERREESLNNLREKYGREGYNDADFNYAIDRRPDEGRIDLTFFITEGPRSVIHSINVAGNDHTSDNLIRSQLELKEGDPLDPQKLSRSRRNLYSTGAYSLVDIQRNALDPAASQKAMALDIKVGEVRPFQVTYGAYFDTDRGPGGIVDVSNRNSLGSARVVGVRARYDSDLQETRFYFSQPLLRRFPLRTTASTFIRREIHEDFQTDRIGFSIIEESHFRKHLILNYGYRMEKTHTYDRGPDPIFDLSLRVAAFSVSLSRDTRDELLDATRGSFISNAVDYAPTFSGSELNFVKYYGQYFRYFAFDKPGLVPMQKGIRKSRLVFATGVRVGLAGGLNGQNLIPGRTSTNRINLGERFFAGGGTTVRGFVQDGIGPRLFDGVSPAGGDAVFILNNELRFPLKSIFDGVGFVDLGNVYERVNNFRPWDVRKTAGFGLRVRTPYFLIRADYGFKLDRQPGETMGRFFFSIGQAF